MRCDTGRCRDSRQDGRSATNAGAQGKPQPDAHGGRELQGETAPARASDRKITADGKEGPGDRAFTLPLHSGQPGYDGVTATPAHARHLQRVFITTRPGTAGRVTAEPPGDILCSLSSRAGENGEGLSLPLRGQSSSSIPLRMPVIMSFSVARSSQRRDGSPGKISVWATNPSASMSSSRSLTSVSSTGQ